MGHESGPADGARFVEPAALICKFRANPRVEPTEVIEAGRQLCAQSWTHYGPWRLDVLLLAARNAQVFNAGSTEAAYHTAGAVFAVEPADASSEVLEMFRWWRDRWAGWTSGDENPMQLSEAWLNARALCPPWYLPPPRRGGRVGVGCPFSPVFGGYEEWVAASRGIQPPPLGPVVVSPVVFSPRLSIHESAGVAAMVRAHRDLMVSGEFADEGAAELFLARATAAAEVMAAEDWSGPAGIEYLYVLLGAAADVMALSHDDEFRCRAPAPLFEWRPTSAHERVLASFDYWAWRFSSWVPGHTPSLTELRAWFAGDYVWSPATMELSDRALLRAAPGPFAALHRLRGLWSHVWSLAYGPHDA